MVDFFKVATRNPKKGVVEVYPKFIIKNPSNDLMIRGGDFYAIWLEDKSLWSTNEQDALNLIDRELDIYVDEHRDKFDGVVKILYMWDSESGMIDKWHKYCQKQMRDSYHMLDEKIIFSNDSSKKEDYASKRLSYPLEEGDISAYDKLISTLYSPDERKKIEWAIGSIVCGDSKSLEKFIVLYGDPGSGKGTILKIINKLFDGYSAVFDAKSLGNSNNSFALEAFRDNPLVAIQYDGDLSRIEDNTRLNSLISHETMMVNEKFKATYANRFKCFLFMGTNKPVKITDAKSGLLRRLLDVTPSGNKVSQREYNKLLKQIDFELGAIASHCLKIYTENPDIYIDYIPLSMMGASNDFFNFMSDSYFEFMHDDGIPQSKAWEMYKAYCEIAKIAYPMSLRNFKEELKNYFKSVEERYTLPDGTRVRNYYLGFKKEKIDGKSKVIIEETDKDNWLIFKKQHSLLDDALADFPAQYAVEMENSNSRPEKKWEKCKTTLKDLDTTKLHYTKCPENYIFVDFDFKDENGKKDYKKNLEEASKWPKTYGELSKSEAGIHLHYIYTGNVEKLANLYSENIEIKRCSGDASIRRKLTKCNDIPIAKIGSGLPLKERKGEMVNVETLKSEKALRKLIERNLRKDIHPGTKPSIDFIVKILDDAHESGLHYDVSDMRNDILVFAMNSTNHADYCVKMISKMKFKSEESSESIKVTNNDGLCFYDIEVFPNLFLVCWKYAGEGKPVVKMFNPSSEEIEKLVKLKLVGFNCRRYDNHLLYARMMGYSLEEIYRLSWNLINDNEHNHFFREAYNISYTDVWDFCSNKQSLKKWEIELGIHHQELGLPWDKPVPQELWNKVAGYCENDVIATEAVFNKNHGDFIAREILADLAGGTVNDTTNSLTTRLIFGNERKPVLVYTDLATGKQWDKTGREVEVSKGIINSFPGYEYISGTENRGKGKNMYRGEDVGFGGYVYGIPGMYGRTMVFDVKNMHGASIVNMDVFGNYTKGFADLREVRNLIKTKEYDEAKLKFDGKLAKYLDDEKQSKALSSALKLAINSVYGLTSATFDNPMRDSRNKNNIVALRGALFMVTLRDEVISRGFKVISIKTDSIKIVNPTDDIKDFIIDFGLKYGYEFEIENIFERICLVNNSTFIAKCADDDPETPGKWIAKAAQFQVPYVLKKCFTGDEIIFEDLCVVNESKKGDLYLDMNEDLPDVEGFEKELDKVNSAYEEGKISDRTFEKRRDELIPEIAKGHNYIFVGRVGQFSPIKKGCGGGVLYRCQNEKYYAVSGTTGYRWLESEIVKGLGKEADIDISYYDRLVDEAIKTINKFGSFEKFVSDEPLDILEDDFINVPEGIDEEVPFN